MSLRFAQSTAHACHAGLLQYRAQARTPAVDLLQNRLIHKAAGQVGFLRLLLGLGNGQLHSLEVTMLLQELVDLLSSWTMHGYACMYMTMHAWTMHDSERAMPAKDRPSVPSQMSRSIWEAHGPRFLILK